MKDQLYSYDGDTGRLNSRIQLNQLIDVDKFTDYAFVSREPFDYWVVNLVTGEFVRKIDISSTDRLSTCQLNFNEGMIACVDPTKVSSVNLYSINDQTSKSVCLPDSPL